MHRGHPGGAKDLVVACLPPTESDGLGDRSEPQVGILQDNADLPPHARQIEHRDVHPVEQQPALGERVQTGQRRDESALATTRCADDGNLHPRLDPDVESTKNEGRADVVAESGVHQLHLAAKRRCGRGGAIRLHRPRRDGRDHRRDAGRPAGRGCLARCGHHIQHRLQQRAQFRECHEAQGQVGQRGQHGAGQGGQSDRRARRCRARRGHEQEHDGGGQFPRGGDRRHDSGCP